MAQARFRSLGCPPTSVYQVGPVLLNMTQSYRLYRTPTETSNSELVLVVSASIEERVVAQENLDVPGCRIFARLLAEEHHRVLAFSPTLRSVPERRKSRNLVL